MDTNTGEIIYSVSKITQYIKNIFSNDGILQDTWVLGEISNFKLHSSGHMYFILKDENSQIRCVMFRGNSLHLNFLPRDGIKVKIRGSISVYEKRGEYQLYAREILEAGKGELYLAFEKLKNALKEEGLFLEKYKKPIPFTRKKFAVITSPTGAAIRDIISISMRRFSNIHIVVVPALVQGINAARDIAYKIDFLNQHFNDIDFIIIGRGGGSIEELWAFNEEILARSIFQSKIPIVSAVGHETDFTISDFAADLRSPTPSAAAEMNIPDKNQLLNNIYTIRDKLKLSIIRNHEKKLEKLKYLDKNLRYLSPENKINQYYQFIDEFVYKSKNTLKNNIKIIEEKIKKDLQRLDALNPWSVIKRGYSVCRKIPGYQIVKKIEDIKIADNFEVIISNGRLLAKVDKKEERQS